jgi:hypothetical protein
MQFDRNSTIYGLFPRDEEYAKEAGRQRELLPGHCKEEDFRAARQ